MDIFPSSNGDARAEWTRQLQEVSVSVLVARFLAPESRSHTYPKPCISSIRALLDVVLRVHVGSMFQLGLRPRALGLGLMKGLGRSWGIPSVL